MVNKERLRKTKEILEDSETIIDKLNMLAADDGMITRDEIELINVIEENINRYKILLNEIIEDDVVDDEEVDRLKELEHEISNLVQEQAIVDGKISVPESELMNSLFDCLKSFTTLKEL